MGWSPVGLRPVWKGIDREVLNRLHDRGFITDPKSKAKSVIFTGNETLDPIEPLK